jgi:hypothetical protein
MYLIINDFTKNNSSNNNAPKTPLTKVNSSQFFKIQQQQPPPPPPLVKKQQRVAIIGSGPSGIVSAKYCAENGLRPVVFEKENRPGGLWAEGTSIWDDMHTNVSRYSVMFSDFPWPDNEKIIPSAQDVLDYLKNYIKHFKMNDYFKFNSNINHVKQLEDKRWQIEYTDTLTSQIYTVNIKINFFSIKYKLIKLFYVNR